MILNILSIIFLNSMNVKIDTAIKVNAKQYLFV